jgi:RNA-directed DNA polymerase
VAAQCCRHAARTRCPAVVNSAIENTAALADWLCLEPEELAWYADLKQLSSRSQIEALRHYRFDFRLKQSGGVRLIEAPKPCLKALQRQILEWLLAAIPPHPAAHGFVQGRGIQTFAAPHVGKGVVVRMDIRNFFPAITRPRIQRLFRTAGYPEIVADTLGRLCTSAVPPAQWARGKLKIALNQLREHQKLYQIPHLPQGAPNSTALANLRRYRVDRRLSGLARAFEATYTRYADDLAFSGERNLAELPAYAAAILREEGFQGELSQNSHHCLPAPASTSPAW